MRFSSSGVLTALSIPLAKRDLLNYEKKEAGVSNKKLVSTYDVYSR